MHAATEAAQGELQSLESELEGLKSQMAELKKVPCLFFEHSHRAIHVPLLRLIQSNTTSQPLHLLQVLYGKFGNSINLD